MAPTVSEVKIFSSKKTNSLINGKVCPNKSPTTTLDIDGKKEKQLVFFICQKRGPIHRHTTGFLLESLWSQPV